MGLQWCDSFNGYCGMKMDSYYTVCICLSARLNSSINRKNNQEINPMADDTARCV